jgi:hypothetical protein
MAVQRAVCFTDCAEARRDGDLYVLQAVIKSSSLNEAWNLLNFCTYLRVSITVGKRTKWPRLWFTGVWAFVCHRLIESLSPTLEFYSDPSRLGSILSKICSVPAMAHGSSAICRVLYSILKSGYSWRNICRPRFRTVTQLPSQRGGYGNHGWLTKVDEVGWLSGSNPQASARCDKFGGAAENNCVNRFV